MKDHRGVNLTQIIEGADFGKSIEMVSEPVISEVEHTSIGVTTDGWIRATVMVELDLSVRVGHGCGCDAGDSYICIHHQQVS